MPNISHQASLQKTPATCFCFVIFVVTGVLMKEKMTSAILR